MKQKLMSGITEPLSVPAYLNICRFLIDTNITVGVELALLRTVVTQFTKTYVTYPVKSEIKMEPDTGKLKTKLHMPQRVVYHFFI